MSNPGRPPATPGQPINVPLPLLVTQAQKSALLALAASRNVTVGAVVRKAIERELNKEKGNEQRPR